MIKLTIGTRVKTPFIPIDTYELVVTGMSGDGDHYEKTSDYGDQEQIAEWINILNAVSNLGWNARCGDDNAVFAAISQRAKELEIDPDEAKDWYSDMVGSDITTNNGLRAMFTGVEVFWYDPDGNKFNVNVEGVITPA